MFVMLFGYPPFHADADSEIFRLVLEGFNPIVKKGYKVSRSHIRSSHSEAGGGRGMARTRMDRRACGLSDMMV